jgi:hypothetical protein
MPGEGKFFFVRDQSGFPDAVACSPEMRGIKLELVPMARDNLTQWTMCACHWLLAITASSLANRDNTRQVNIFISAAIERCPSTNLNPSQCLS